MGYKKAKDCLFVGHCIGGAFSKSDVQAGGNLLSHTLAEDIHGGPDPKAEGAPNHPGDLAFHQGKSFAIAAACRMDVAHCVQGVPLSTTINRHRPLTSKTARCSIGTDRPEVVLEKICRPSDW